MGAVDDFLNKKPVVKVSFWGSHKKAILTTIAVAAAVLLVTALIWYLYFNSQFLAYQDNQYNFSIRYPKAWQVILHPARDVAVVFRRPKDTALDTFQDNFNVTVQGVTQADNTIGAFSSKVRQQMTAVFGKTIKIVEDRPVQFGWRQGHKMVIEAPDPDHLKMVNAWVLTGGKAYILTFIGDMNRYDDESAVINEMIRSLNL
jgi:hypothetical protein